MNNTEDFFKNYRGRYSSYWIERWGLIPELPTSFDNANSIYELLAWLQRAFKNLLDDFQQLESEFEDFKNAIIDLLEYLIPELIRRYHKSEEFRRLFIEMLKDILSGEERTWFKDFLKEYEVEEIPFEALVKDDKGFKITQVDEHYFLVEASWFPKVLKGIDIEDYEALQYMQRVLEKSGIFNALREKGIEEGDIVSLYDIEFEYVP